LGETGGLQLVGGERLVGRAEVNRPRLDLSDSAARTDRLIIDLVASCLSEVGSLL